jgi:hypothetical protein
MRYHSATLCPLTSAHYKWAWFAGCGSSAPAHFRIFQRHWLVSSQPLVSSLLAAETDPYALQSIRFVHTLLAFTPTFSSSNNFISYHDIIIFNHALLQVSRCPRTRRLHSLYSLFCSCPVCSRFLAHTTTLADERCYHSRESQQQARSVIGLVGPTHFGDFFKSNNSRTLFPGYITARDTVDLDQRASFSGVVKVLSDLAHNDVVKNVAIAAGSGAASTGAAYFANKLFNNTR